MKKNSIIILASAAMLAATVTVSACAIRNAAKQKAGAPVVNRETVTTKVTKEINDGQNPVMNFTGNYYGGRACITVEPEGTNNANITVVWGDSYNTKAVWTMSGAFDEESTSVVYNDGIKKVITLNEKGDTISEELLSVGCKGVFVFSYDGIIPLRKYAQRSSPETR